MSLRNFVGSVSSIRFHLSGSLRDYTRHMPLIPVQSLDDPRLAPYRNLKERELAREGDRFIAEGENLVKRLLASA